MYEGRTLTMWDTLQEWIYFLWVPVALILIGIALIIWLTRK